jgi:uncharacterized protein (DUF58 family)
MVKEFTVEGLHRCTVVFDPAPGVHGSTANFETGVTAAASLVASAMRAGLITRFVTAGGIDLRGPEVAHTTLRVLARIEPSAVPLAPLDNDMADGLLLLVVVTGSRRASAWQASRAISDPTITRVLVATNDASAGTDLGVVARTDDEFVAAWQALVGQPVTAGTRTATEPT